MISGLRDQALRCARYVRRLGPRHGLAAFAALHRSAHGMAHVSVPAIAAPVALRRGTSDVVVFDQVFLQAQYDGRALGQWPAVDRRYRAMLAEGVRPVIVDCGANIGLASVFFQNQFPDAAVVAIEPEAGNFAVLRENCVAYPRAIPVRAAISDRRRAVRIANPGAESWTFRVEDADPADAAALPAITIGDAVAMVPNGRPLVVKIDIEGAEEQLFRDNLAWLRDTPILFIELHDWMRPWAGSSQAFRRALAELDCDVVLPGGENLVVFSWSALGVAAGGPRP